MASNKDACIGKVFTVKQRVALSIAMALITIVTASQAIAGPVRMAFDTIYAGDTIPNSDSPWLIATFEDTDNGNVLLTIENFLQDSTEHIKAMRFNLDPTLDASSLNVLQIEDGPMANRIAVDENGVGAGPAWGFDIRLKWGARGDHFSSDDLDRIVQFELSGIEGLNAESFAFMNQDRRPDAEHSYYAAANIGNFGQPNYDIWVRPTLIPLPLPALMAGLGLMAIPFFRRRMMA